MNSYMERCIHLKACRRVQAIGAKNGHQFARHCDENCTAYVDGEAIRSEWERSLNWAAKVGHEGYGHVEGPGKELYDLLSGGRR